MAQATGATNEALEQTQQILTEIRELRQVEQANKTPDEFTPFPLKD